MQITPDYLRYMARYNRWQNGLMYAAAETLSDAGRRQDRGAFFGSIHCTLSHLIWGDLRWIARYDGGFTPDVAIADSPDWIESWDDLKARRTETDTRISDWVETAGPSDMTGNLELKLAGQSVARIVPRAVGLVQLFNHQTHHRGQVSAMLTAAGAPPYVTDIPFLPPEA